MPLSASRFTRFPYFFKLLTTFFSIVTLIALSEAPSSPGGTSLIWFSVIASLIIDSIFVSLLLFELDRVQVPIKGASYSALESSTSLTLSIFYFISIWLCINGEEFTSSMWFYIAAFASFANFVLYAANFAIYLRVWLAERRAAGSMSRCTEQYGAFNYLYELSEVECMAQLLKYQR